MPHKTGPWATGNSTPVPQIAVSADTIGILDLLEKLWLKTEFIGIAHASEITSVMSGVKISLQLCTLAFPLCNEVLRQSTDA